MSRLCEHNGEKLSLRKVLMWLQLITLYTDVHWNNVETTVVYGSHEFQPV